MRFIFIFLTCCLIQTAFADQLIVEPDRGRAPILDFIHQSRHSLNLVMYDFTDKTLLNALLAQQHAGNQVKVILEKAPYKNEGLNINTMNIMDNQKLAWHPGARYFQFTHQKSLVSDDQQALIMTFNFTLSSFKNQRNFALLVMNPKLSHDINATFNTDWQQRPSTNTVDPHLLFSPNNSREGYTQAIHHSLHTIDLYQQSLADAGMVNALCDAARRGVRVRVITSKLPTKQFNTALVNAGVIIEISKKLYIHAKALGIDNHTLILGSVNFTPTSLDHNRELAIITTDPSAIQTFMNTFNQDWEGLNTNPRQLTRHPAYAFNGAQLGLSLLKQLVSRQPHPHYRTAKPHHARAY